MKTGRITFLTILCAVFIFFISGNARCDDGADSSAASTHGVALKDGFEPGVGAPVGKILMMAGDAVIRHQDENAGYRARKGLPLYKGDTLITREKARLRFSLNDGSMMTMASDTSLTIDRAVYDPDKKSRSTFMGLDKGKARFWAVKMKDYKTSEFNVKTKTAVAGIRGSDFVVAASGALTEVTALKDTLLALISLSDPEAPPLMLSDFQRSRISEGALPTRAERVGMDEIEHMMREFLFKGERFDPDNMIHILGQAFGADDAKSGAPGADTSADEKFKEFSVKAGILLPKEALIEPDVVSPKMAGEGLDLLDVENNANAADIEKDTQHQETDFSQQRQESDVKREVLPEPAAGP